MAHKILLYYKYVRIEDPEALKAEQQALCRDLGLSGRILVAHEGINGTVEGTEEAAERYMRAMDADHRFAGIHWKVSDGTGSAFPRLSVKAKPEIVATRLDDEDVDPTETTGVHLKPEELHEKLRSGRKVRIIDMRNDYEYRLGHFEGSVFSGMRNFRDLRKIVDGITPEDPEEEIVTVCTGGVRCEKASGYLLKKGFRNVYQLDGGIVSYMEKYPSQDFKGSLYVFDGRTKMHFDTPEDHVVVAACDTCGEPSEEMVNCANIACHRKTVCCLECAEKHGVSACSDRCREVLLVRQRERSI